MMNTDLCVQIRNSNAGNKDSPTGTQADVPISTYRCRQYNPLEFHTHQ